MDPAGDEDLSGITHVKSLLRVGLGLTRGQREKDSSKRVSCRQ